MKQMLASEDKENFFFMDKAKTSKTISGGGPAQQKSGRLQMLCSRQGRTIKVGVILTVYGGTRAYEHYAILSQDAKITKNMGFINLRQCVVEKVDNDDCTFGIIQSGCDGNVLTLTAPSRVDATDWLECLGGRGTTDSVDKRSPLKSLSHTGRSPLSDSQIKSRMNVQRDISLSTLCETEEE